jgi:hypothetical protein
VAENPSQRAAPVVPDQDRPAELKRLNQTLDVVGEREHVVTMARAFCTRVATKIRRIDPEIA